MTAYDAHDFKTTVSGAYKIILRAIQARYGLNTEDENFRETPDRCARALEEILSGLDNTEKQVTKILSRTFPAPNNLGKSEMLVCGPVHVWSLCPHHLLPVEMDVWVGYLPNEKYLGLSKLARLSQVIASAPAMQEETTQRIAWELFDKLNPLGTGCHIKGKHLCMSMRGAKQSSVFSSTALFGAFADAHVKQEFLDAVRSKRG